MESNDSGTNSPWFEKRHDIWKSSTRGDDDEIEESMDVSRRKVGRAEPGRL